MNKKQLYESIMSKVAAKVRQALDEMDVHIPENGMSDDEAFSLLSPEQIEVDGDDRYVNFDAEGIPYSVKLATAKQVVRDGEIEYLGKTDGVHEFMFYVSDCDAAGILAKSAEWRGYGVYFKADPDIDVDYTPARRSMDYDVPDDPAEADAVLKDAGVLDIMFGDGVKNVKLDDPELAKAVEDKFSVSEELADIMRDAEREYDPYND